MTHETKHTINGRQLLFDIFTVVHRYVIYRDTERFRTKTLVFDTMLKFMKINIII
jgi:hypothetical protein